MEGVGGEEGNILGKPTCIPLMKEGSLREKGGVVFGNGGIIA